MPTPHLCPRSTNKTTHRWWHNDTQKWRFYFLRDGSSDQISQGSTRLKVDDFKMISRWFQNDFKNSRCTNFDCRGDNLKEGGIMLCVRLLIEHKNKSVAKRLVCCSRFALVSWFETLLLVTRFNVWFVILNKVICYSFVMFIIGYCSVCECNNIYKYTANFQDIYRFSTMVRYKQF